MITGITTFKNHINEVMSSGIHELIPKRPQKNKATLPFTAKSKN